MTAVTLTDVKTQLMNIETQFTIPISDLAGMVTAARAQLDNTLGSQMGALETQISDLQNELMILQAEYVSAEAKITAIEETQDLVAKLKDKMANV